MGIWVGVGEVDVRVGTSVTCTEGEVVVGNAAWHAFNNKVIRIRYLRVCLSYVFIFLPSLSGAS